MKSVNLIALFCVLLTACSKPGATSEDAVQGDTANVALEVLDFIPVENNPVFAGTGTDTWDQKIRERGYILVEDGEYHMWYTGFRDAPDQEMHLGYATSPDGLIWTRYPGNPIFDSGWVEDMMVVKEGDNYYMFAEGRGDIAHMLTSMDRIHWKEKGPLDIRNKNGEPISEGPYGTPTVWRENGVWYLFYERGDLGIWLATSSDLKVWTNKQDEPVINIGPETYDKYGVAVNQIIKHKNKYYAYYHATEFEDWHEWTSCVAISDDLVHWVKYDKNPIMRENKSSPILVPDGEHYRLYTMHDEVHAHLPRK
ncbi:MAG: glycosylase [Cyclobacteriaceae bacterium]|nr:glycosylase [Cyclobacteriaceae bacterium]MDH4296802.1 glycosylase [Cyclobacteriaceae bacterium]MDH5248063.1 glycosylase [Cyclobacteriaceae bacterium]